MITNILKIALLVIALATLSACTCNTNCSRGEPMARQAAIALRDVHFPYDSAELTPTAKQTLKEDYDNLHVGNSEYKAKLLLEGRADERGNETYNHDLSAKRVASVRSYLESLGVQGHQFEVRQFGEDSPLAAGSTPDAWAKNRSVRVLVM